MAFSECIALATKLPAHVGNSEYLDILDGIRRIITRSPDIAKETEVPVELSATEWKLAANSTPNRC